MKGHRYQRAMMNRYIDNNDEPQLDETEKVKYREKVKDMDQVKFEKKKKNDRTTKGRKRKLDEMEKPVFIPFKKHSNFFKNLS
jgi:hypothetical protein